MPRLPHKLLSSLLLLLLLGACATSQEQAPLPPADATTPQEREHKTWVNERDQAIQTLRLDPHLSITELKNRETVVRIRSGDLFRSASTTINPAILPVLEHIATTLGAHPTLAVRVIGHTDNVGPAQQNVELSLQRAQVVRNALIELGVDAARITHEGKGDTEPLTSNSSREGRAVNRRVDLLIPAYSFNATAESAAPPPNDAPLERTAP